MIFGDDKMFADPKTLYISDLDGTLLNRNAELSEYTASALNNLIDKGVHFSVATARTAATSVFMLERVNINVPIILMNGVLIYDMAAKQYAKKEMLSKEKINQILLEMKKAKQTGLMYALSRDELVTYYENIYNAALRSFIDERVQKYNKVFTQIDDFGNADTDVIYFCYMDTSENILDRQSQRNLLIAKIFQLCGLAECSGQGMNLIYELTDVRSEQLARLTDLGIVEGASISEIYLRGASTQDGTQVSMQDEQNERLLRMKGI
jgi:hydroxymethylpyrimidine pyrophosphatase-like HAD family hydrolase